VIIGQIKNILNEQDISQDKHRKIYGLLSNEIEKVQKILFQNKAMFFWYANEITYQENLTCMLIKMEEYLELSFASTFHRLNNLKVMYLCYNQLTNLNNKLFEGLTCLKELNLSFNNMTNQNNDPFKGLTSFAKLDLLASNDIP